MDICSECMKECTPTTVVESEPVECWGNTTTHEHRYTVSDCCKGNILEEYPENSFTDASAAIEEAQFLVDQDRQSYCILCSKGALLYVVNYDDSKTEKYRNYRLLETITPQALFN